MAQTAGYLLASPGPLAIGLLHSATGSWNLPVTMLLALTAVLLPVGLLAARPRVVPGSAPPAPIAEQADERGATGR
jgi:cyanate permease